jgi:hypothetical protein
MDNVQNCNSYTGCFKKELYNGILNVTVWIVLRKLLHLKAHKHLDRWIVCAPSSVNVFETLATQSHLESHLKRSVLIYRRQKPIDLIIVSF